MTDNTVLDAAVLLTTLLPGTSYPPVLLAPCGEQWLSRQACKHVPHMRADVSTSLPRIGLLFSEREGRQPCQSGAQLAIYGAWFGLGRVTVERAGVIADVSTLTAPGMIADPVTRVTAAGLVAAISNTVAVVVAGCVTDVSNHSVPYEAVGASNAGRRFAVAIPKALSGVIADIVITAALPVLADARHSVLLHPSMSRFLCSWLPSRLFVG